MKKIHKIQSEEKNNDSFIFFLAAAIIIFAAIAIFMIFFMPWQIFESVAWIAPVNAFSIIYPHFALSTIFML